MALRWIPSIDAHAFFSSMVLALRSPAARRCLMEKTGQEQRARRMDKRPTSDDGIRRTLGSRFLLGDLNIWGGEWCPSCTCIIWEE